MRLERISLGIPALDQVLEGGVLKGGVYIVQGAAGAGKTILANQIAFAHVAAGAKVIYITLLSESHARMMQHMELFSFYREDAIPSGMLYISAFNALAKEGLSGVANLLSEEIRRRKPDLIVLDGLVTATHAAPSAQDLKLFIGQIQEMSTLAGCNTLLLNSVGGADGGGPEQTMVDGIVTLRHKLVRSRHERTLEVVKFRGSNVVFGAHTFRIGGDGIVLFPQLEAIPASVLSRRPALERVSAGVPGLDEMLGGGYPAGSVTAVSGPEGAGKTLLGLHFLSAASIDEPALLFGVDESGEMATAIAAAFGIDIEGSNKRSRLHIAAQPRFGESLDEVGYRLLAAVKNSGARRVFVDGLSSIIATPAYQERGAAFFAALFRELRRLRATTLFSVRVSQDGGAGQIVSPLADNSVRVTVSEHHQTMVRSLAVLKVQASRHDMTIRALELTSSGLQIGAASDER